MSLADWQAQLLEHFKRLRAQRSASVGEKPIFGLEHGLSPAEVQALSRDIREHITHSPPSRDHRLPWIVYAAELGYRYSGDEYWQTFEDETAGWGLYGDRHWIRNCFRWFHAEFGGAKPSGPWANHFSIICWPITHAILPRDLQRQLARILFQLRHSFSRDVFASPTALGELIAARSWDGTSRFQNLAQETLLVGQIAAALLLEGDLGTAGLLLPATLKRIGSDLDQERSAREWLRGARRLAQERARVREPFMPRPATRGTRAPPEHAREEAAALAIEPRLVLRPTDAAGTSWDVLVEIPDLSPLLWKFPNCRDALADSRCTVAGAVGRPLARGRLMHGAQQVLLGRWPRPDEVLLQFERPAPELEYLLRAECLLRPGPTWLFRVASDGQAYELRSLRTRPGQRYIVISTEAPIGARVGVRTVALSCEGAQGVLLDLPNALGPDWAESLVALGLTQAKSIQLWPAGLAPAGWDGEGRGEWLASEKPCIAICADHAIDSVRVAIAANEAEELELGAMSPGVPVFVELPSLPIGVHKMQVRARVGAPVSEDMLGELELVVREPRPWAPGVISQGPLIAEIDPATPTLEQLWEGRVEVEVHGPTGRLISCTVGLFEKGRDRPTISKSLPPLKLPITPSAWAGHFEKHFRAAREVQNAYDMARACELEFRAEDLGAFEVRCEREFTPLRWAVQRSGNGQTVTLLDDSGSADLIEVGRIPFEAPDREERLEPTLVAKPLEVPVTGGMYFARRAEFIAAVVVPPAGRTLADLSCNPQVADRTRSPDGALRVLRFINLWAKARLTGNLFSWSRRREVLHALTRHLFFIFGGDSWERAEQSSIRLGADGLRQLQRAVSTRQVEAGLAESLTVECPALAQLPSEERIGRLASLARKFLHLPPRVHIVTRNTSVTLVRRQAQGSPDDPDWLCEFALRLASDPASALPWAGPSLTAAVKRLFDMPVLARAARFLVLAVDRHAEARPGVAGRPYAGWEWR